MIDVGAKSKKILRKMNILNEVLAEAIKTNNTFDLEARLREHYPDLFKKYNVNFRQSEKPNYNSCLYLNEKK